MNTLLQLLFGLAVLSLPMIIAGGMVVALAASVSLVPILLPITSLLCAGAVGIAWLRWRRDRRNNDQPA